MLKDYVVLEDGDISYCVDGGEERRGRRGVRKKRGEERGQR